MAKAIAIQAPVDRRLSYAANIMATDYLVLKQTKVPTAVILILSPLDIQVMPRNP